LGEAARNLGLTNRQFYRLLDTLLQNPVTASLLLRKACKEKEVGNLMLWRWFCDFLAAPRHSRLLECKILQFNKVFANVRLQRWPGF
jgi:hypothetical protein